MKFTAGNRTELERRIDPAFDPGTSVVCRYRDAMRFDDPAERDLAFKRHLLESSIREGARVVPLLTHGGVAIHILDETSLMATGSLKAIDGCLAASLCRAEGIGRIAFESGGNTGSALTRYGRNAGLETFFFCPEGNVDLLDSTLFHGQGTHLVAVEDRRRVKELTGLFAKTAGIRQVPDKSWRCVSGMFRGWFILEHMLSVGRYDWISQTISAAFGPIGIYKVLEAFRDDLQRLPGFLGIQQAANCPMYRAWKPAAEGRPGKAGKEPDGLLSRIMYDDSPHTHETYRDLHRLLLSTRGDLLTVDGEEFDSYLRPSAACGPVLELLKARGIPISLRSGRILDKTGLIALVGTLKAVDAGIIKTGSSVLCALTGGCSAADGRALPELTVRDATDVLEYARTVGERR